MTRAAQKEQEFMHSETLLSKLNIDTKTLAHASCDPPDLIFKIGGRTISIEHSILLTDGGEKIKQEIAAFNQLIEKTNELYDPKIHGILRVWVWFKYGGHLDLRQNKLDGVAVELLELSVKFNPGFIGGLYDNSVPQNELPPYANRITIWDTHNAGTIGFSRSSMVISGALPLVNLKRVINKKSEVLHTYKDNYDENWLLLVADGSQASQFANFISEGIEQFQHSQFDHIYILEAFSMKVYKVK